MRSARLAPLSGRHDDGEGRQSIDLERVAVRPTVVKAVLARTSSTSEGPIPEAIARRMLDLERTVSISELAALLVRAA